VPLGAGVRLLAHWGSEARLAGIAVESHLSLGDTPLVGHPAEASGGRLRGRIFLGRFLSTGIFGLGTLLQFWFF
jgi:hypothetical protein